LTRLRDAIALLQLEASGFALETGHHKKYVVCWDITLGGNLGLNLVGVLRYPLDRFMKEGEMWYITLDGSVEPHQRQVIG